MIASNPLPILIIANERKDESVRQFMVRGANPAAASLLRRPQEDIEGRPLLSLLPSTLGDVHDWLVKAAKSNEVESTNVYIEQPEEGVEGYFNLFTDLVQDWLLLTIEDVSYRQDEGRRMRAAISASSDGFWELYDLGDDEMWWSQGLCNLLGVSRHEEPSWKTFTNCVLEEDRVDLEQAIKELAEDNEPLDCELRFQVADRLKWFRVRARVIHDLDMVRVVGSLSDIDKQKQAEGVLRDINRELEERIQAHTQELRRRNTSLLATTRLLSEHNEYLKDFAAFASHDLREPLRKIRAYGSLLEDETEELSEDAVDYISRMNDAAGRMETLIEDLLVYARATGKQAANSEISLNEVVEDVLSDLEVPIAESRATVEVGDLPSIACSRSQIRQVMQNLIGNALKYRKSDTSPRICISGGTKLLCSLTDADRPEAREYAWASVKDNGIGFDPNFAQKIFAPFKRLNARTAYKGSGIGLAVCKRIVERHDGFFIARGSPGNGAEITFYMPLSSS